MTLNITGAPSRRAALAAGAATLAVASAGCSPPAVSRSTGSARTDSSGRTVITWFQWWASEQGWDRLGAVKEAFEHENPDVVLDIVDIPSSQAHDKLISLALAGQVPDVFTMAAPWIVEFAMAGIVQPVTGRFEAESRVYQDDLDTPMLTRWSGDLWGVPITNGPVGMFYNKAILRDAGVDVPRTWDELQESIPAIRSTGRYALTGNLGLEPPYPITYEVLPLILAEGGDVLDEDGRPAFDSPEGVRALERLRDLYQEGATPGAFGANESAKRENFVAGNTAYMFESPAGINIINGTAPELEYGVAVSPAGRTAATMLQGSLLGMSATTPTPDAAWTFLRWIGSPTGSEFWSRTTNFFPANRTAIAGPGVQEDERLRVFADVFTETELEFIDARLPDAILLRQVFTLEVHKFLDGRITAAEALSTAAATWRETIDDAEER